MSAQRVSLRDLFAGFFMLGVTGFGGVMPWARRALVEERRWLAPDEFASLLGLCQFLPGANIVNLAVCVGARFQGAKGSVVALAGLLAAPFVIVLVLGALYSRYSHLPTVAAAFSGISAVGAGLVVAMGVKMALTRSMRSPSAVFAPLVLLGIVTLRLPLVIVLAILLPTAVAFEWWRQSRG